MYTNPVCDYRRRKDDTYFIRLIIVGEKCPYLSESVSPVATLLEAKIIFKRIISTTGSLFICADVKYYFIFSPMERFKCIKYLSVVLNKKYTPNIIHTVL